ncbi:MAG: PKD domain-containing protein [Candidatus Aminicenantes bacterium]|jgi:PKD repeat protein
MMKYFIFFVVLVLMLNSLYAVDETLVKIAEEANIAYYKPEVEISPSGDIYVAYQAENQASGRSEIYLSKYSSSGRVSFLKNLSDSSAYSYEPEIKIPGNGYIHAAWADQTNDTHVIKYRYFNGSNWSNTINLGQVGDSENIEDLRIDVDESGNVFVVFMYWPAARCIFIGKYGNNISFENFPLSGRSKHPDVAADSNYVHIVWQYKPDRDYTIAYQRRPNQRGSNWEPWIDLEYYGTQRPRMSLDNSNTPHVDFFHKPEVSKRLMYKKKIGNRFSDVKIMSDPNRYENYHFCDISAVSGDNMIVTLQKGGWAGGQYVSYNWKRNGTWNGYAFFSKTNGLKPTKQSVDLASDRFFAAVAFCQKSDAVYLLLAEEAGGPGGNAPTASFTFSPLGGHAPLDVTFDASASSDPDGQITNYNWNFGDSFTGTGQTILHRYETEGEYTVTLTVTDDDGKTHSTSHIIIVDPPNQPPVAHFTFSPTSGLYPLTVTFDASSSTDVDGQIVQYEWDFDEEQISGGPIINYTFTEEGLYKIILTVYDDDDASATASGTVEVLGLVSPLNIAYEAMINRNLFTLEHVYRITWESNPENALRGANIVQYNIYRKRPDEGVYSFVATIAAGDTYEYYDRIGTVQEDFIYTVTAVDDQGRESDLPNSTTTSRLPFEKTPIKDIKK